MRRSPAPDHLVRVSSPRPVHNRIVETGAFHGWSTSWLSRALADNGTGHRIPTTSSTTYSAPSHATCQPTAGHSTTATVRVSGPARLRVAAARRRAAVIRWWELSARNGGLRAGVDFADHAVQVARCSGATVRTRSWNRHRAGRSGDAGQHHCFPVGAAAFGLVKRNGQGQANYRTVVQTTRHELHQRSSTTERPGGGRPQPGGVQVPSLLANATLYSDRSDRWQRHGAERIG
jgi:hypothetical protein